MLRVVSSAVQSIDDSEASSLPLSVRCSLYAHWPQMLACVARDLCVDVDELRRHQVCELYSHGYDKMAEEVRLRLFYIMAHCIASTSTTHNWP
jgi:hypothetical protein